MLASEINSYYTTVIFLGMRILFGFGSEELKIHIHGARENQNGSISRYFDDSLKNNPTYLNTVEM